MIHRKTKSLMVLSCLGALLAGGPFTGPITAVAGGDEISPAVTDLNLAFTAEIFGGYNRDDAIAAIDVWISKIIRSRSIAVSPVIEVYDDPAVFEKDVRSGRADLLGVRADKFLQIESRIQADQMFGVVENGNLMAEYLLLTHADGIVSSLEDLKGRSIIILDTARSALAPLWLDTVLMRDGLPPAAEWLGQVDLCPKVSRTLLPVFFNKTDACLVPRESFETSIELNPQVGKKLRPILKSTPIAVAVIGFHTKYDRGLTEDLASGLLELHEDPQGQQVLLIFGADKVVRMGPEDLNSVRMLLEEHKQLCAGWPGDSRPEGDE